MSFVLFGVLIATEMSSDIPDANSAFPGDENRPKCVNCTKRGAACEYPNFRSILLNQVPSREVNHDLTGARSLSSETLQRSGQKGEACPQHLPRSSSNAFEDSATALSDDEVYRRDASLELSSTPEVNQDLFTENRPDQSEQVNEPVTRTISYSIPSVTWDTTAAMISTPALVANNTHEGSYNTSWLHSTSSILDDTDSGILLEGPRTSTSSRSLTDGPRNTRQEDIQILSHYRYHLAPWLDVNNARAFFGNELLSTARDSPIIMSAILNLAAMHKSIMSSIEGINHTQTYGEESVSDLQNLLLHEPISVQRKCRLLLRIGKSFGLGSRGWKRLASESNEYLRTTLVDKEEEPLFSWCFQIGT